MKGWAYKKGEGELPGNRGLTLIEIIAVLIILGIATSVVAVRGFSITGYPLASDTETLKAHLRYAHYRALSDTEPWGIAFSQNAYSLMKNMEATDILLPGENSSTRSLSKGIAISTGAGTSIHFNEWGNPVDTNGDLLTANRLIVLSGGGTTQNIIITENTGFIP